MPAAKGSTRTPLGPIIISILCNMSVFTQIRLQEMELLLGGFFDCNIDKLDKT
jgi:hypothetical protein